MAKFLNNGDKLFQLIPKIKAVGSQSEPKPLTISELKQWRLVAKSYYQCGLLINKLFSNSNNNSVLEKYIPEKISDILNGYPSFVYLFLYRQYLELTIKLLYFLNQYPDNEKNLKSANHKLNNYWNSIKENYNDLDILDDLNLFTKIIEDFSLIDPDSFRFRYSHDKKGNYSFNGHNHFALIPATMWRVMERIKKLLDFLTEVSFERVENKHE